MAVSPLWTMKRELRSLCCGKPRSVLVTSRGAFPYELPTITEYPVIVATQARNIKGTALAQVYEQHQIRNVRLASHHRRGLHV